jgi:hypothetical protein
VDCTYTNKLQQGALLMKKNSTKGGAVANPGAKFTIGTKTVYDNNTTQGDLTDADTTVGKVCVPGLAPTNYTINETSPPDGYGGAPNSEGNQSVTVAPGTDCGSNLPDTSATATFTNPPLSDIQVNFRDGGSGETSATTTCDNTTGSGSNTPASEWDTSRTVTGVKAPTDVHCTISIDP